jgi:antitoxin PrlF
MKTEDIMSLATVSSKGQITLPAKIRQKLGIRSKDKVQFFVRDNEIVIKTLRSFRELRGSIAPRKGDERKAVRDAVARHVMEVSD